MTANNGKFPDTGRTAAGAARRQQLIDATIESIAKHSFAGTTLDTLTKEANLSHGIVNFYFKSKEALFAETLGFLAQEHYDHWHTAMTKAGPDPSKQLVAIVETDFKSNICSLNKLAVWFAFWALAKHRPAYLEVSNRTDEQRSIELERLCGEIVEDGGYDHIDPASATRIIESMIDGLWLNMLLYPNTFRRTEARDNIFAYLGELFPHHFARLPAASD